MSIQARIVADFVDWCTLWHNGDDEIGEQQVDDYVRDTGLERARPILIQFLKQADEIKAMKDAAKRELGADDIRWA